MKTVFMSTSFLRSYLLEQWLYTVQRVLDVLVQLRMAGHLCKYSEQSEPWSDVNQDNTKWEDLNRSTSVLQGT